MGGKTHSSDAQLALEQIRKTPQVRAIGEYLSYCRTKYIYPLNLDYYWKRYGFRKVLTYRKLRRRTAAEYGLRPMHFRSGKRLPWEFIRLDPWEMPYLYWAAARARKGIVETGRFYGGSTLVMALANSTVPVFSIDIAPKDDDSLRVLLSKRGIGTNARLIVGDSQRGEFGDIPDGAFDLLFVDGDHSFEGCLGDLEKWWPRLASGGSVILHDCYHGSEVQDAVEDFFSRNEALTVRGANIPAAHWLTSQGSLAHFRKP